MSWQAARESSELSPLAITVHTHKVLDQPWAKKHKLSSLHTWSTTISTEAVLLFPTSQKPVTPNSFSKEEKKQSLIMGPIFSFAAEDSFGAYSFRNKCSTNNRHNSPRERYEMWWRLQGKKGNEDQYDDDKWKTLNEIRGALEGKKCKETFIFTCISIKGKIR